MCAEHRSYSDITDRDALFSQRQSTSCRDDALCTCLYSAQTVLVRSPPASDRSTHALITLSGPPSGCVVTFPVFRLFLRLFFSIVHVRPPIFLFFFLNNPAPTEIYPLPLHDALPISHRTPEGRSGKLAEHPVDPAPQRRRPPPHEVEEDLLLQAVQVPGPPACLLARQALGSE